MIVQCCVKKCGKTIREKEPYEDASISHTFCPDCFQVLMSEIRARKLKQKGFEVESS